MSRRAQFLLVLLVATIAGFAGFTIVNSTYLAPRRALNKLITTYKSNIALVDGERSRMPDLADALQEHVDRTLGPDIDTVDHRLRSRLHRVGEEIGLAALSVSSGEDAVKGTPARGEFNTRSPSERVIRDEVDFVELTGTIGGEGSYPQAIDLIAALQAEPWIKQIYSVRLDPIGDGKRFRINVRLRTLFFPGRSPSAPLPEGLPPVDRARLASLLAINPFALPAPPVVIDEPTRVAHVPKPPAFPYDNWVMTGIVTGPDGKEVWLLEAATGQSRVMLPGETISDLKLVDANGEVANFELNGRSIQLLIGQNLGEGVEKHE